MSDCKSPTPRVGYIRTVLRPNRQNSDRQDYSGTHSLLAWCVRQETPTGRARGGPGHRFVFGAVNSTDALVLDILTREIQARSPAQLDSDDGNGKWYFKHMTRLDVEVRMSESHASTHAGGKLLKRCADEGIPSKICGTDDDECDEIMLHESHYLIDFATQDLCYDHWNWFQNHVRTGIPENSLPNNEKYDMRQHDFSQHRLSLRYAGYGWKKSSGGYHGNGGHWRCNMCGGNCKRGKCKGQASGHRVAEQQRWEEQDEKWRQENLRLPGPKSEIWKTSTAFDMCQRFRQMSLPQYQNELRWHSIDTFSGE